MKKIIIGMPNSLELAKKIARKLKCEYSTLKVDKFPDSEVYIKYLKDLKGKEVVLVNSFHPYANKALVEILWAAYTAKDLGAKKVTLVAPYLGFMRQDKRFNPGEAISAHIASGLLNKAIDKLVTIDPHLHRIPKLSLIYKIPNKTLTANNVIAKYLKKHFKNEVIIGPDAESYQWAKTIADKVDAQATILKKHRYSSRKVAVKLQDDINIKGKDVVIIDDIISTGHTMIEAAKTAKKLGAKNIYAMCIHPLFVEKSYPKIKKYFKKIISTNTITHKTNDMDVSSLLCEEL